MKFQSLCMSLFCAATLAAALPVEPSAESATQACIPAEFAKFLLPGTPKDLFCKGKAQPEKRHGEPSQEECYKALVDYRSGNASEEEVGPLLDDCVAAYGPPPLEKRQAPPPSGVGGVVSALKQAGESAVGI
ncbi:hypothetical protein BDV41DRAFT_572126 [Aspergillus transmontanensis]|uniref:Uncharacterized protein n=1 Tax=Aspergillus transmontanensis TaxID=1034304 RepID=A0A5N6WBC8_9EURO|nr:hypothetical protein BDV41DRAFT_572126 [Aspergillus transmontanensis]